jgi:hypothetical protein
MRLDGKLLSVALAVIVLGAGLAMAEEPVKGDAPAEKQTEEKAAETAKAKQSEKMTEAEGAETAKARQSEKMTEAEGAETAKAKQSEKMTEAESAEPAKAKAKTADAKAAEPAKATPSEKAAQAKAGEKKKAAAGKKMAHAPAENDMAVSQIAICETVQERAPVGEADSFSSEIGKLWCFTRVQNAAPPTQIFHRWYVGDELVDEIAINVKGSHWRCWSTKTIDPSWTGECRVEILTEEGDVISTKPFVLGNS